MTSCFFIRECSCKRDTLQFHIHAICFFFNCSSNNDGWVACGNKIMFDWSEALAKHNYPLFSNDRNDTKWVQYLPRNIARMLMFVTISSSLSIYRKELSSKN